jgi:hypothetical protein
MLDCLEFQRIDVTSFIDRQRQHEFLAGGNRAAFRSVEKQPRRLCRHRQASVSIFVIKSYFLFVIKSSCPRFKLDSALLPWALHDGKKKGTDEAVSVFILDVSAGNAMPLLVQTALPHHLADTAAHEIDVHIPSSLPPPPFGAPNAAITCVSFSPSPTGGSQHDQEAQDLQAPWRPAVRPVFPCYFIHTHLFPRCFLVSLFLSCCIVAILYLSSLLLCNTLRMYIDSAEPAQGSAGKFVVVTEHVVPLYAPLCRAQPFCIARVAAYHNPFSVIDPCCFAAIPFWVRLPS